MKPELGSHRPEHYRRVKLHKTIPRITVVSSDWLTDLQGKIPTQQGSLKSEHCNTLFTDSAWFALKCYLWFTVQWVLF